MSSDDLVCFHSSLRIPRRPVRALAAQLKEAVAGGAGFSCLIARDEELRRLNREFRGMDQSTDVLSFPVAAGPRRKQPGTGGPAYLGDIAISANRAAEQARELGHPVEQEIGILMLHGVLHLMGMDHEKDRGRMRRTERKWRERLGLPQGLTERV